MRAFQVGFCAAAAVAVAASGLGSAQAAFQPTFIFTSPEGRRLASRRGWGKTSKANDALLLVAPLASTPNFGESLANDDGDGMDRLKNEILMNQDDDEEYGVGGGSSYLEMMEAAQRNEMATNSCSPSSAAADKTDLENFLKSPGGGETTTPPITSSMNPDEMTTEQQAEMFRKIMQGQMAVPGRATTHIPPQPQQQQQPMMQEHRRVGRNRDADVIQNSADLYFAQLKRDSTVRTLARHAGDQETAEAVFQDDGIDMLKDMMYENPHLTGQREQERELFDTATDEMLAYEEALKPKPPVNEGSSGISYKQKLMEKRARDSEEDN